MIKKSSFTAYSKNSSYGNTVFLLLIVVGLNKRWCLSEKRMFFREQEKIFSNSTLFCIFTLSLTTANDKRRGPLTRRNSSRRNPFTPSIFF